MKISAAPAHISLMVHLFMQPDLVIIHHHVWETAAEGNLPSSCVRMSILSCLLMDSGISLLRSGSEFDVKKYNLSANVKSNGVEIFLCCFVASMLFGQTAILLKFEATKLYFKSTFAFPIH